MKQVILLGSNGQLGTDVVHVFGADKNIQLTALTRSDIDAERHSVFDRLADYDDSDVIVNCISYHKTDECEDYPEKSFKINSLFVGELARFCAEFNILLIHISTDYVFGGKKSTPYLPDDPVSPLNVYGMSKVSGELYVKASKARYAIVRVSSLFGIAGVSGKGGNSVETMISLAKEGKPLKVIADQMMSPTHTLDVARALHALIVAEPEHSMTIHCCNSGSCSWYEFTREIFDKCNLEVDLIETAYAEYKTKAIRPKYSAMDNSSISKYFQMPDWKTALTEYLKAKGHLVGSVSA